jgi:hypothetical protein
MAPFLERVTHRLGQLAERWSYGQLGIAIAISMLIGAGGLTWATILYERSAYPPALIPGQLNFSPESVRGWYEFLLKNGTFEIYRITQLVDFIFIAGLLSLLFFIHILIAKAQPNPGWRRLALVLAAIAPAIAASDVIENIFTLIMLSNPTDFAPWLAYIASTLSVIKWSWCAIGSFLLLAQFTALIWFRSR